MKIEYDTHADAMYIRYTHHPIISTKESQDGIVDYDANGQVVGIEMLGVKELFQKNNLSLHTKKLVTH